jgi:hypothetical protein
MGIRDAGNRPQSNDRLPFVYVENRICIVDNCKNIPIYNYKKQVEAHYCREHKDDNMITIINKIKLQGERIENPVYMMEHRLKIDYLFYITNQIMKPALQFLELIAHNPQKIFKMYIIREENRKGGINPIMKYYNDCPSNRGKGISVGLNGLSGNDLFGEPKQKLKKKHRREKKISKRIL